MKRTRNPKTKSLKSKAAPRGNGHRTNGKRSKFQMEEDISFVAQNLSKGLSVPQIHKLHKEWRKEYSLTERSIFNDANEALDRWRKLSHEAIDIEKGRHLMKLENIERTAWMKLETDKNEISTTEVLESSTPEGQPQISKRVRKQVNSNSPVDWMKVVQWTLEQRAKILGLYAPLKGMGDIVLGDKLESNSSPVVNIQINSTKPAEELTEFPTLDVESAKIQELK